MLFRSSGHIKLVDIEQETLMAGLSCGEVSRVAWPILRKSVKHALTFDDTGVVPMMRWLANPTDANRPAIEGGECSASGLIGVMAAAQDPALRAAIGLTEDSSVLVFGTEGATDPELYAAVAFSQSPL